jgi:chromosome partitioning protein
VAVVVCLAAEKGGVGKSTVAANLAAAFALEGLTTVLIDLDPQGTASSAWLNVDAGEISSVNYLIRPEAGATMTVGEGWHQSGDLANLYVVPADHDALVIRGRAMVTEMNAGLILRNRLQALEVGTDGEYADVVIIDTKGADPHEPLVASGLIAADYVLPVLIPEPAQLDGIVRVVQAVHSFTADGVTTATVLPPLVNQFPHANQGRKAANVAQSLLDDAGVPLAATRIHAWSDIRMAQAEHVPVAVHAPKSKAAGEYRALAKELTAVMNLSVSSEKAVS